MKPGEQVRRTGGQVRDGQLGTIVEHDGGLGVRLDRRAGPGGEGLVVPFRAFEWTASKREPLPAMHVARITYDADRALRVARGDYGAKDWVSLPEQTRVGWAQVGPPREEGERRALFEAIRGALG